MRREKLLLVMAERTCFFTGLATQIGADERRWSAAFANVTCRVSKTRHFALP
jgi:hypothetical protein